MLPSKKCLSQNFDVRNTIWGMTMQEVIESEGRNPEQTEKGYNNDDILLFTLFIEKRKVDCGYHFLNGRLVEITYRYNWGTWQSDQEKDFSSRYYSIFTFFNSLNQKNYRLTEGWYILNAKFSETGKRLSACLGDLQSKTPFAKLNKVEECFNKIANLGVNGDLYANIRFENQRTRIEVSFPLKNHDFKDKYIGWITFDSKLNSSDF
jgi:hypothetical protein